ncbi:unnamed protein product [Periconia digitata]|uniref:Acyl-CoA dehydrogenase n=1 Tax=Periconia digitata TaxID=1303443 RepID=A0A9W4UPV1_9PLEO|nr:unnamed protein product [Periconia digitata]
MTQDKEGDHGNIPWAEPAWHGRLPSPHYSDSHRRLQSYCRNFIDTNIFPHMMEWEAMGSCPRETSLKYVASGLAFLDVPIRYRPEHLRHIAGIPIEQIDAFHRMIVMDETARIAGGCIHALEGASSIGAAPVIDYGTELQQRRWLPSLFTWETSFCLGVTEVNAGSDISGIATVAIPSMDETHYEVTGSKKWVAGGRWATHMTTLVRTGQLPTDLSLLVIPLKNPGVSIDRIQSQGYCAAGLSWIHLNKVKVPADHLIGKRDKGIPLIFNNFVKERLIGAVCSNRRSRLCLSLAIAHAYQRKTFGRPIATRSIVQYRLSRLAQLIEQHWAFLEHVVFAIEKDGWQSSQVIAAIASAKSTGGRMLELTANRAQLTFGSSGFERGKSSSGLVEMISREVKCAQIGGGTEEILAKVIWRESHKAYGNNKL